MKKRREGDRERKGDRANGKEIPITLEERRLVLFSFFFFFFFFSFLPFFFVFPCLYLLSVLSFPFPPLPPTGLLRGLHETRGHDARMCHGVILSISLVRVAVTRRRTRSRAPAAPARHPKQPRVSSQPGCLFKVNLHVYVYVHTTNTRSKVPAALSRSVPPQFRGPTFQFTVFHVRVSRG